MSRKIDLVYDTIRAITNVAHNQEVLKLKVQMLLDNDYDDDGVNTDPLTDADLVAEPDLAYLTYEKFTQAKDVSDALIALFASNNIQKKINQLRGLTGK